MKYYNLGSIGNFNWTSDTLDILKNVLRQTVYSVLNGYKIYGFIHGDLHCDNVLLKKKRVLEIDYNYKKLEINTYEVRIMDFEKSKFNKNSEFKYVLNNIEKLCDSIIINERYLVKFNYKNEILRKMKNLVIIENINVKSFNDKYFDDLDKVIDSFYIEY